MPELIDGTGYDRERLDRHSWRAMQLRHEFEGLLSRGPGDLALRISR
jgi:hypothetical protein